MIIHKFSEIKNKNKTRLYISNRSFDDDTKDNSESYFIQNWPVTYATYVQNKSKSYIIRILKEK